MYKFTAIIMIALIGCASLGTNLDKFETAANAICDGMSDYEQYRPQLRMIKDLVEQKDYMTALYYAKGLYTEVHAKGDTPIIPEVVSLITVLQNLASRVPLKIEKPEPGLKVM